MIPPHTLTQRVYYEDTDFSGLIYHAGYLKFLERGRTEWLRSSGIHQKTLFEKGYAFVVVSLTVDFVAPAQMDDLIHIHTTAQEASPARMVFSQTITRTTPAQALLLIRATVEVACINRERKPVRIRNAMQAVHSG